MIVISVNDLAEFGLLGLKNVGEALKITNIYLLLHVQSVGLNSVYSV